jgi:two-component system cell cycle response regulator CpdR
MIRILLAEDDSALRTHLTRALERAGYRVDAVDRGTEALKLLEHASFDLLLTNIMMPELDGIELAQRAAVLDPAIRVMFITGFAAVALEGQAVIERGKNLSKPFHLRDLVKEVERMFEMGSVAGG